MAEKLVIQGQIDCGELEGLNVWEVLTEDAYANPSSLWKALSDLYFSNHRRVKITIEVLEPR
jgi:hypothetical protein